MSKVKKWKSEKLGKTHGLFLLLKICIIQEFFVTLHGRLRNRIPHSLKRSNHPFATSKRPVWSLQTKRDKDNDWFLFFILIYIWSQCQSPSWQTVPASASTRWWTGVSLSDRNSPRWVCCPMPRCCRPTSSSSSPTSYVSTWNERKTKDKGVFIPSNLRQRQGTSKRDCRKLYLCKQKGKLPLRVSRFASRAVANSSLFTLNSSLLSLCQY